MAWDSIRQFIAERESLNELVLAKGGKNIKRFFNLDHNAYEPGALPKKTKEMLGLVASLVLRCDDCINYHLVQCHEQGVTGEEFEEILTVGLVVGGSITIPHLRRAFRAWAELDAGASGGGAERE